MNLSKEKRERLLNYLEKLKENKEDEDIRIISEIENALNEKKYGLVWEEHSEKVDEDLKTKIPLFTEVKDRRIEKDKEKPYNFLLEGDNLHSLKLLQKTHKGKIDVIYIDPPYNTGEKGKESNGLFIFNDKIIDNTDGYKHSKWISFMNKRLIIAKNLLTDNGIILISIGREEVAQLRLLCDEIFGENNLLGQVVRRTKTTSFRGNYFSPRVDYVLVYTKGKTQPKKFRDVVDKSKYNKIEKNGERKGEFYKDDTAFYLSTLETRPNQRYFIECPDGELVIPPGETIPNNKIDGEKCVPIYGDGVWRWEVSQYKQKKNILQFKKSDRSPLLNQYGEYAKWNIYTKSYYNDKNENSNIPEELLLNFINRQGTSELKKMDINFTFPKPINLIKYFIYITNKSKDCLILDFFAGFRVIIMTQANSQVNTRVLELLPKFKIKKMNRWCAV